VSALPPGRARTPSAPRTRHHSSPLTARSFWGRGALAPVTSTSRLLSRRTAFLVLLVATLATPLARAHPIHLAHANIAYNRDAGRLEIELRAIADDLLAALNVGRAVPLSYEKTPATELNAALQAYVQSTFALTPRGESAPLALTWVGREADTEGPHQRLWIYLEATFRGELEGASVRQALLLDTQPRQENTARVRDGQRDVTLHFVADADTKTVRFAK